MIYFIQDEAVGLIKIGYTGAEDADQRLRALQTGCPAGLTLLHTMPGSKEDERALHQRFAAARSQGEWFRPVPALLQFLLSQASPPPPAPLPPWEEPQKHEDLPWPYHIYLAGKIAKADWRSRIVKGLTGLYPSTEGGGEDTDEALIRLLNDDWPVLEEAVLLTHHYVGPYFIRLWDGIDVDIKMFDDEGDHGAGLSWIKAKRSGSHLPRTDIVHQCLDAIKKADVLFAWIDQPDCYGTLVEVGYAKALGKVILAAGPRMFRDMWFVYESAQETVFGAPPDFCLLALLNRIGPPMMRQEGW